MQYAEFVKLTHFYPASFQYELIEEYYYNSGLDKEAFCKAYASNKGGIAEEISNKSNGLYLSRMQSFEEQITSLKTELSELYGKLETEEEWGEPFLYSDMAEEKYRKYAASSGITKMSDKQVKDFLKEEGFDPGYVTVIRHIPYWQANRHKVLRKTGSVFDCPPLYFASDMNYIRFCLKDLTFEYIDGQISRCGYEDDSLR